MSKRTHVYTDANGVLHVDEQPVSPPTREAIQHKRTLLQDALLQEHAQPLSAQAIADLETEIAALDRMLDSADPKEQS